MPSLDAERTLAVDLVRSCAQLALEYQRGGTKILRVRNKPLGGGPVTAADEALDARIVTALRRSFPDDAIVAEESHEDGVWHQRERCWFVDPIDGTREFAHGTAGWTVQLGLCIRGEPVLGVVAEPGHRRISWAAVREHGTPSARWEGATTVGDDAPIPLATASRPFSELRLIGGKVYPFSRQNAIRKMLGISSDRASAVGSVGVRMAAVARGHADAYVQAPGKTKMWDTCPPLALVLAAGGRVTDLRGEALRFDAPPVTHPAGVIACAPHHHDIIRERLADLIDTWVPARVRS